MSSQSNSLSFQLKSLLIKVHFFLFVFVLVKPQYVGPEE